MSKKNINLKVGDVVFLKSDIRHKHPLTISEIEEDEDDIDDWEIECKGITTGGKPEWFSFESPNMLVKMEDIPEFEK